jgi:hypothetical protein
LPPELDFTAKMSDNAKATSVEVYSAPQELTSKEKFEGDVKSVDSVVNEVGGDEQTEITEHDGVEYVKGHAIIKNGKYR